MESKRVLLIIADGCEDLEIVSPIDVFTRAGIPFTIASANGKSSAQGLSVKCAWGSTLLAHEFLEDCEKNTYEMIALPGGLKNAESLGRNPLVVKLLKEQKASGRFYCAICASPALVFQANGIIDTEDVTSYPAFWEKLGNQNKVKERVVVSGKCITSQGPGTAIDWALALVEALSGKEKAKEIGLKILNPHL